jgi:hypothetical protein
MPELGPALAPKFLRSSQATKTTRPDNKARVTALNQIMLPAELLLATGVAA